MSSDLEKILEVAKGSISIIIPIAVGLLALNQGIDLVRKIIKQFKYAGVDTSDDGYDSGYWTADEIAIFEAYDRGEIDSYYIDEDGVHPL
jgi:hypothetical protein